MEARCLFVEKIIYIGLLLFYRTLLLATDETQNETAGKKKTFKKMCFVFLCSSFKEPYVHNAPDWSSSADYSAHLCPGALGPKKKQTELVSFPARQIRLAQD